MRWLPGRTLGTAGRSMVCVLRRLEGVPGRWLRVRDGHGDYRHAVSALCIAGARSRQWRHVR